MWKALQKRFSSSESYVSMALGLAVVLMVGTIIINYLNRKPETSDQGAAQTNQKEETSASLPTKHTISEGETLWSISEKYYKTGYNWQDISNENKLVNADAIEVGQIVTIPKVTPIMPQEGQISASTTDKKQEKRTYTVKDGDYLWKIAEAQYNDGYMWTKIAQANNINNPNLIYPESTLVLP